VPYRILVVEDSSTMRSFVSATLEDAGGFEITSAASGFEALRTLPRAKFDLIITDVNMPDINGLELIKFLRDSPQYQATPLVIISTDGHERDRDRGLALGADEYLTKPFPPEELVRVCRKHLERRQ
jgi:two-component system chemotaxis response regulator CheY